MADPIDVAKDVSIAFLSTSALLLTLILGFISPILSKGTTVTLMVQLATLMLIICAGASAGSLYVMVGQPVGTQRVPNRWYDVMFFSFLLGVGFVAFAIIIVSTPTG